MKNWNLKLFLGTGIGVTIGMLLYDLLSYDSIGWIRAILAGVLVMVFMYIAKKMKSEK